MNKFYALVTKGYYVTICYKFMLERYEYKCEYNALYNIHVADADACFKTEEQSIYLLTTEGGASNLKYLGLWLTEIQKIQTESYQRIL